MDRPVDKMALEAMARFASAEGRLYPMALSDPSGYERATSLVAVVAEELRKGTADLPSVLEQRSALIEHLPDLAAEAGMDVGGLPPDAVVDAASALRCRELGVL